MIELNRVIDWEFISFPPLSTIAEKPRKSAAGRKRIEPSAAVQDAGIAAALQFGG